MSGPLKASAPAIEEARRILRAEARRLLAERLARDENEAPADDEAVAS